MTEPAPRAGFGLAVVIPTLNEERPLYAALESLRVQTSPPDRLVVADGGSRDGTVGVAERYGADVLVVPGRGRGGQVAAAVARLDEDVVLVAHADMRFPAGALAAVRQALAGDPACPGGCLGHRFDRRGLAYRLVERWDRRRGRRGESYGDQAQFFRRDLLASAGGFPDQVIMEDVELARRLRRLGRPLYLELPVTVSARRFERLGWWRVVWTNWACRRAYRRGGVSACQAIYDRYYRPRHLGGVRGEGPCSWLAPDP
jgi:glycosyltransferase involved in cell wall biosynthesis